MKVLQVIIMIIVIYKYFQICNKIIFSCANIYLISDFIESSKDLLNAEQIGHGS